MAYGTSLTYGKRSLEEQKVPRAQETSWRLQETSLDQL